MLGNEKIDQDDSFTYLGSIIRKDGGCSEDVKSRIAKARVVFTVEIYWRMGRQVCEPRPRVDPALMGIWKIQEKVNRKGVRKHMTSCPDPTFHLLAEGPRNGGQHHR